MSALPLSISSIDASAETAVCLHCGTAFRPTSQDRIFCCAGCHFVHDLIQKNSLEQYYNLRGSEAQPVKSLAFQKRDYVWLEEMVRTAELCGGKSAELVLDLQGVSCIGCVWLIEKLFSRKAGGLNIRVDPTLGRMEMSWVPGAFDVIAFAREIQTFGYLVGPQRDGAKSVDRGLLVRMGLCGALALNTMLFTLPGYLGMQSTFQFAPLFARFSLILGTLSFIIGGSYFFSRTWHGLRQGVLHIDLPISIGLIAAYACSLFAWAHGANGFVYFDFVAIFPFLMLAGRWLQQKAVASNRHLLLASQSFSADVQRQGTGEMMPVEKIDTGERYLVRPGQPVPIRSRLLSPAAMLGLEWINGESEAVMAPCGRAVSSGAINCGANPIELEALEKWSDSLLARLTAVSTSPDHRNPALERFIRAYIFAVLGLSIVAFAGWWWVGGSVLLALQVFTSILVVSCPCASGVALPLVDDLAVSSLRRSGVFVRTPSLWPRLERVRKIIFDKTGTLTLETMALRDPQSLERLTGEEKATLLAMILDNLHPVSCCLRELLLTGGIEPARLPPATETIGAGLEMVAGGEVWRLGRSGWAGDAHGDCIFSRDGQVLAAFSFSESVRSDAAEEIAGLRARGNSIFILSGDRREKVETMARRLGLPSENCYAGMSPGEKANWVARGDSHDTLFIGDGANDSLAFDHAWCTGTPAIDRGLLERKADFYFVGRGLAGVRRLFETTVQRRKIVRRVVAFALAYNGVAIAISLAGAMSPVVAAILMPLSSLVSLAIVVASQQRR
jgi:Cu2+-exporting ATPase